MYQAMPLYSIRDVNQRQRFLKYTPEHMHCEASFCGPAVAPNTGIIAFQTISKSVLLFQTSLWLHDLSAFPFSRRQFEFRVPHRAERHGAGASSHLRGGEEVEVGRHSAQSLQEHGLYHRSYIPYTVFFGHSIYFYDIQKYFERLTPCVIALGMFSSALEVAKFEHAKIKTVSGIRGSIKRALTHDAPAGSFRATFEDKILMSDLVICRSFFF